ncbi:hypothetical protein AAG570_009237 [Ranatra chinensis]|uniref:RNA-directed DNA polymerase n=1 Tax=Ranatra chinensis TaxID=642074 RepID=A0ABD0ZEE0_9HEMI
MTARSKGESPGGCAQAMEACARSISVDVVREEDGDFLDNRIEEKKWTRISSQRPKWESPKRSSGYRDRPEPMEVNVTDLGGRRKRYVYMERDRWVDSSGGERTEGSSGGDSASSKASKAFRTPTRKKTTYVEVTDKVAGMKPMIGEVDIDLKDLVGIKAKGVVHVASIPEKSHDMIIGTYLLRPFKSFMRLIDEFLFGLDENFIQAYTDDLVIFSKNRKDRTQHLEKVKNRLKEFGSRIPIDKSYFCLSEVKFMEHVLSKHGSRPDPGKVSANKYMKKPSNLKELRSFLGMVNFCRRFTGNLADKIEPLTKLLQIGVKLEFSIEAEKAFEWCKEILTIVPVLQFPDFNVGFTLTTDASKVLSQGVGIEVVFASRKLTPAETSRIERELLGIVWATKHFRPYLLGRQFTIKTAHKPLVWVEKLEETSARISRWKETLAAYIFKIIHTKGSENVVADCLSRQVNAREDIDEDYAGRFLQESSLEKTGSR